MTYEELLATSQWQNKRTQIIIRDANKCKACHNSRVVMQMQCAYLNTEWPTKGSIILGHTLPEFKPIGFYNNPELLNFPPYVVIYYVAGSNFPIIHFIREMFLEEEEEYIHKKRLVSKLHNFIYQYVEEMSTQYMRDKQIGYLPKSVIDRFREDAIKTENWSRIRKDDLQKYIKIDSDVHKLIKYHQAKGLNVHHTYYQSGKLPWEYPDGALETYCRLCHVDLHAHTKILKLDKAGHQIGLMTPCVKCGGAGEFPEYRHVLNGICFECNGARYIELK